MTKEFFNTLSSRDLYVVGIKLFCFVQTDKNKIYKKVMEHINGICMGTGAHTAI